MCTGKSYEEKERPRGAYFHFFFICAVSEVTCSCIYHSPFLKCSVCIATMFKFGYASCKKMLIVTNSGQSRIQTATILEVHLEANVPQAEQRNEVLHSLFMHGLTPYNIDNHFIGKLKYLHRDVRRRR